MLSFSLKIHHRMFPFPAFFISYQRIIFDYTHEELLTLRISVGVSRAQASMEKKEEHVLCCNFFTTVSCHLVS